MDYKKIKEYVIDNSSNFLGTKASFKDLETFEYVYDLLIEALEKQHGKKPIKNEDLFYKYCPSCNKAVFKHSPQYGNIIIPHCKWCGQKIDWD